MNDKREDFERWVDSRLVNASGFAMRHRYLDGYCQNQVNDEWRGWKAALAALTPAVRSEEQP